MKRDSEDISQLILKKLRGKLSEEEECILNEWMGEHEGRKQLVKELNDEFSIRNYLRLYAAFNTRKGWKKLEEVYWKKPLLGGVRFLRVAVVVFLFLGSGIFFLNRIHDSEKEMPALMLNHIRPGVNQAVLVLEDGQEVNLQEASESGHVLEGDTWKIGEEGRLCYGQQAGGQGKQEELNWHTLRVPRGGEYTLVLEDGTQVWLNSESELKYPVYFGEKERRVILSGQAYFKVAYNGKKAFIVETAEMNVRVFGTSFDVMAYQDDASWHTTLVEGSVEVADKCGKCDKIVLKPGWQANYTKGRLVANEVDTDLCTSWIHGRFTFQSEELEMVLRKLERWYNVRFIVENEGVKQKRFSGSVSRYAEISKILDMLELTTNIRFDIQEDKIVVGKN